MEYRVHIRFELAPMFPLLYGGLTWLASETILPKAIRATTPIVKVEAHSDCDCRRMAVVLGGSERGLVCRCHLGTQQSEPEGGGRWPSGLVHRDSAAVP